MTVYHCPAWVSLRLFVTLLVWFFPPAEKDQENDEGVSDTSDPLIA